MVTENAPSRITLARSCWTWNGSPMLARCEQLKSAKGINADNCLGCKCSRRNVELCGELGVLCAQGHRPDSAALLYAVQPQQAYRRCKLGSRLRFSTCKEG